MPTGAPGQSTYTAFRADSAKLENMVNSLYFGANDGMLHVVDTNSGAERFAYVPNSVFEVPDTYYKGATNTVRKLYEISRPDYAHLFTADGPPQIADAFIGLGTPDWKSVLVSSTGAGSRGVFAIDITNPEPNAPTNPFGTSNILWEYSEVGNNDSDMGYIPYYPNVAKMQNGRWVAIFGNGYSSSSGRAVLYLLDLQTGSVAWKQVVSTPNSSRNGLSQPNFLLNGNREVVGIWAGDMQGNLWKFDVNSSNAADWRVAYSSNPLFTTPSNQPITVMPELDRFPGTNNAMVIFGTGRLFYKEDMSANISENINRNEQAIYGIWDNETNRVQI